MTTVLAERPRTVAPAAPRLTPAPLDEVDPDGVEVYCPEAQAWGTTRDLFCETCGDTDHDLR